MPAPPPRSDFVSSSSHGLPLFAASASGASISSARPSDAGSPVLPSNSARIRSASSTAFFDRSTPSCSTRSSVSCRPAVSMRRSSTPPTVAFSSTVSRVVPAMSVTMARSKPTSAFKSELLPAFGAPMMAVATPFLSTFPRANVPRRSESVSSQHKSVRSVSSRERSSMSSSG